MIEIKANITIPQIAKLYRDLSAQSTQEQKINLKLPKSIQKRNFGVIYSLLQFVCTWIRNKNSGSLTLPVSTDEEALEYLTDEFVYPCVVLSWEKSILNNNGENIKSLLKTPSQAYFRKLDFFENNERDSVPIFCFDHDLSKRGKSRVFYDNDNKLLGEAHMDFTLHGAFVKLSNFNKHVLQNSVKSQLDSMYGIISELFTNTHDHARTDEKGFNLYPNLRSMYLKFHKSPLKTYLETYKEFGGLIDFFKSDFKLNNVHEQYLIELTFLDSGPGLVKRYTGQSEIDMEISAEVEIIKECLYIHNTSAREINKPNKGYGLDRTLKLLDGKGFIRIKTGHVDVFRDMKNIRYQAHSSPQDIMLYDWAQNSSSNFTINDWAEGTLISIFYPLDYSVYE